MPGYYAARLSGERLVRCYEIAPPRVQQYLEAEIRHVLARLHPGDRVLELGCGYGRVALRLAAVAGRVIGIDTAVDSLRLGRELARVAGNAGARCDFVAMNAVEPGFEPGRFDAVVCLQNGICAFGVDPVTLVRAALTLARSGAPVLFSSYLDAFWPHRLAWFEAQAAMGLVSEIDHRATGDGVIVCRDGFRAGRMTPRDWQTLARALGQPARLTEADGSSLWAEFQARGAPPGRPEGI